MHHVFICMHACMHALIHKKEVLEVMMEVLEVRDLGIGDSIFKHPLELVSEVIGM